MMQYSNSSHLPLDIESSLQARFEGALNFYKKRSPVIFLNTRYRFWEQHGFHQQSLAKFLTENGVEVIWIDGAQWRPYRPVLHWKSKLLTVETLFQLPLRRIPWIDSIDIEIQWTQIKKFIKSGSNPFIWIHGGIDERLVEKLPSIDVFSVFDDPYCHLPSGNLCQKAKLVTVQNDFSIPLFQSIKEKLKLVLPPVDMRLMSESAEPLILPKKYSSQIFGYLGAFESLGYDLDLFEGLMLSFPEITFLLMGKTDEKGQRYLRKFKKYSNFLYLPWQKREKLASIWKSLSLQLLLYRKATVNDGAFPTKILESLYYGVPTLATPVPKTSSLKGVVAQTPFLDKMKKIIPEVIATSKDKIHDQYLHFRKEMDPRNHLSLIAEYLRGN